MISHKVTSTFLTLLLLASLLSIVPTFSTDGVSEDIDEPFYEGMTDQVFDGIDAICGSVSECTDNLPLPTGAISVLAGVTDDVTVIPQTEPVTGHIRFDKNTEIEQLYVVGGADLEIADGVTLTVDELFIESSGTAISLSIEGEGMMVVDSLAVEGLVLPIPEMTIQTPQASIISEYERDGEDRSFMLRMSYLDSLNITLDAFSLSFTGDGQEEILISADVDLTDYIDHVTTPEPQSTLDRLLRYISSLGLVKLDLDISVGGNYSITGYPMPVQIGDLGLSINSHRADDVPYYSADLHIGEIDIDSVNNEDMAIHFDLPATKMKDGSRPIMDRAKEFVMNAGSINVDLNDSDPLMGVGVKGLELRLVSSPESSASLSMERMAYHEMVDGLDVSTTLSGFSMGFNGTSSNLIDDPKGLAKDILLSGKGVEGGITMKSIDHSRYHLESGMLLEKAVINGLVLNASLVIPQFRMHFDMDSFGYSDPTKELSCSSIGYDLFLGVKTTIDPESIDSIMDLLKLLEVKSYAEIVADGAPDYHFTVDSGRAFIIGLATEGLRAICGENTMMMDRASISGLSLKGDVDVLFHVMSNDEIDDKIPGKIRDRLNGGNVIELSDSLGIKDLEGTITITIKTDIDGEKAGVYHIDTENDDLEKVEFATEGNAFTFKTDKMDMYAVTGPLKEPDMVTIAIILFVSAVILGILTVAVGKWYIKRKSSLPKED